MICSICPRGCKLNDGQTGFCKARKNIDGQIVCVNYGQISAMAVDPIEKKPFRRVHPGSHILSVGSYGCNMSCAFCQNSHISQENPKTEYVSPEKLLEIALSVKDNLGVAFTYNEPLIGMEYLLDTALLLHDAGLKTVLVTNGFVNEEPLLKLLPFVDAMNIDVKCFSTDFYKELGGDLECVKRNVALCVSYCHVEVTILIIPGENDGEEEMYNLSLWLSSISASIPLHLTRFFPCYRMADRQSTPIETLYRLADVARGKLDNVYVGNV